MNNFPDASRCAVSVAAAIVLVAIPVHSRAANWSIADLGAGFNPIDINDHGAVLQSNQVINGQTYYFRAMNNLGQAVGMGPGGSGSYLYENGTLTFLKDMGEVNDINDKGQVIGTGYQVGSGGYGMAVWQAGAVSKVFGSSTWGEGAFGTSINASGQMLGLYAGTPHGNAFTYDGKAVTPFGLAGSWSYGTSINDNGAAVGLAATEWDITSHAFLHTSGVTYDLGTLGGWSSYARDLNNANDVVGQSDVSLLSDESRAFLYRGGSMIDLSLLPEVQAAGWTKLFTAAAINEQGQIVGSGVLNGVSHGFLLQTAVVPEPSTLILAATGLAFLRLRRGCIERCGPGRAA